MKKIVAITQKIMDDFTYIILTIFFFVISIGSLFIKAMYHFDDFPYFTRAGLLDYVFLIISFLLIIFLYKNRNELQFFKHYFGAFGVYFILSIIYIYMVPLKPFSDMSAIINGAINISKSDWKAFLSDPYWEVFPGNMNLAVFWGILLIPFPKSIFFLRVINALFAYLVILFTRLIAKEYNIKAYNIVYVLMLTNMPLFLYINHVYFDLPVLCMCLISIYIYKKYNNIIASFIILSIARCLRSSVSIFMLAILFCYVFKLCEINKDRAIKKIIAIVFAIIIYLSVFKGYSQLVNQYLIKDNYKYYPFWNQIYIGLNEDEFGFMDGDFSYDRSLEDICDRVSEYGIVRTSRIVAKKTFWLWSQGTYQVQRYAFGVDTNDEEEKFMYKTPITKYLLKDDAIFRSMLNSFIRSQYLILFILFLVSLQYRRKNFRDFRVFYYCFVATFLIMLVYELKSRYIFHLMPFMVIFAEKTLEDIEERHKCLS